MQDKPNLRVICGLVPVQADEKKTAIYVFEESKKGLIYGFTVQIGRNAHYGQNAWYLPNWCKDLALSLAANLAAEFSRPKNVREFRSVFLAHLKRNADWIRENKPRQ